MNNTLCISFLALSLTIGCGADTSEPQNPQGSPDAAPGGGSSEPSINGEPASQYYSRFVWENSKTHNYGAAAFTSTNGRDIYLLQFYLNKNQTFIAFYEEGKGDVSGTGYRINSDVASKKRLTGTWRVNGAMLSLGTLADCVGIFFNDQPALQCKLTNAVDSSAATQRTAVVKKFFGPSKPSDSNWADYSEL